jgi:hypothetical protein
MRNEPYNNITIDEQIKINIIDIIFTSTDMYKIYGYDKIMFHDIEMYKYILIYYCHRESNLIWIFKKSIDSESLEVLFYVDIECLLINTKRHIINNINKVDKVDFILSEDTLEKFTIKWDEYFINKYNLLPYDTIMKNIDKIEQSIIASNLSNNAICKYINHRFDNNIINCTILIYDNYKYWLLVCNNKKILRPYFLRDFIPNVD